MKTPIEVLLVFSCLFKVQGADYKYQKIELCDSSNQSIVFVEQCKIGTTGKTIDMVLDFKQPITKFIV